MRNLIFCLFYLFVTSVSAQTTIVLQPGNETGKDAWVWSYYPTLNFGEQNGQNGGLNNVLRAEVWKWYGDPDDDTIRGLIEFDLSEIQEYSIINEAKLSLFFYANPGYTHQMGENATNIQLVTQPWTEDEVNWDNQPPSTTDNQVLLPQSTSSVKDYLDVDVTVLVQEIIDNFGLYHGFMLKMVNEVSYAGLTFASSENNNSSLHPKLEITYTGQSTSISKKEKKPFALYPNPSQGIVKIKFSENIPITGCTIRIIDLNGKLVKNLHYSNRDQVIDLPELEIGQYILEISLNNKKHTELLQIQ